MKRHLISEIVDCVGQQVELRGWVLRRRDHGKIIFCDLRDRSGVVQVVVVPDFSDAYESAQEVRSEYAVSIVGRVKARPGGASNEGLSTGSVEVEADSLRVLSRTAGDLPIDISKEDLDVQLPTLLDHRYLSLRHKKVNSIFAVYSELIASYADAMREAGFREIKTPKLLSNATEGGANFFKVKYFDRWAYLAQSPQFYKQAGVGAFERVFEIGPVFRAEPHFTSRHVNEYVSLDAEMGFIDSYEDLMDQLEDVLGFVVSRVSERCSGALLDHGSEISVPERFVRMKLTEALEILRKEFGKKLDDVDIDPEGERLICEYVKREYGSDFVFLTHYPAKIRPMYAMPSDDPQYTNSFDLLYRGVEIATGGQRIHEYAALVENIKRHGLNPEDYADYLEMFKYAMPPHGGWGMGSERVCQKFLGLASIKEAIMFPRDVKRLTP
ncbi:MAG: aspartate--tRNA(Asn) ligase [Candidatus Moranbacteria bacterium]|nr:aspartate--tRNA(Asn) ligase [Candidatus Moranbacteria bacterium]